MRNLNHAGLLPQATMDQYAIAIVGAGAIGSFCAMALTKMGFKHVVMWDDDKIEEHNLANQMYPMDSIGKRKALAAKEMIRQFSGEEAVCLAMKAKPGKVEAYMRANFSSHKLITVLAVDSLDTRKQIVEGGRHSNRGLVVDARMGARTYRVMAFYAHDYDGHERYLQTLVPDAEAVQERCGQKSIIYTVLGVAAEVCNFIHHYCTSTSGQDVLPPVVFDYGTGMRLQQRIVGDVVDMTQEAADEIPI